MKMKRCRGSRKVLPGEVIGRILSLLPLKEAARTSVVCKDWRTLWSNYFSGSITMEPACLSPRRFTLVELDRVKSKNISTILLRRSEFITSMNRLLVDELKYPYLKEFKVIYILNDPSIAPDVDFWIRVVASKQVETLDLNFLVPLCPPRWSYTFSWPPQRHSLKVLRLRFMRVSGQTLQQVLACCPLLEELNVSRSPELGPLEVSHGALRRLEVDECGSVGPHIAVVSAPSLAYLKFASSARATTRLSLVDVPRLTEVFLGSTYAIDALDADAGTGCDLLHRVLPEPIARRLKQLTLDLSHRVMSWGHFFRKAERTEALLKNLTHLNLIVPVRSLLSPDSYTPHDVSGLGEMASPAFHRFVPELRWKEICHKEWCLSENHACITEKFVKRWLFNNTNGGLFTITWFGESYSL